MTSSTAIEMFIDPRRRPVGSGSVRRLLPFRLRRMVGPFVFTDIIGPDHLPPGTGVDVDAHPHIGLATVTYLLQGRMVHRDSTGAIQTIEPGAVNWMTAGRGVTHTERSHPEDIDHPTDVFGLQTWVALPTESEESTPGFEHAPVDTVPVETVGRSKVSVAVGSGWSLHSSVETASPLVLAHVDVHDTSPVPVETPHREIAVVALTGSVTVNDSHLDNGRMAVLAPEAPVQLGGTGTAVVLGGEPVGPRHIWWNFVHHDPDRIEQAKDDWMHQRFPTVPGDHDPFVPLPSS